MKEKYQRDRKTRTMVRPVIEWLEPRKLLSAYTLNTLALFNHTDGANPYAGVTFDSSGDLFGTTYSGGASSDGTVFEIAQGTTSITTLASFNGTNGGLPFGGVVLDSSGDIFGTTSGGGSSGVGTVFEIVQGTNSITTLASFNELNGGTPQCALALDSNDNIFGTSESAGGSDGEGDGTVFEIAQGTTSITTLASFNGTNGASPLAGVTLDSSGDIFGTTYSGGASSDGTVFEIVQASASITTIASFNSASGGNPSGMLTFDSSGDIFGTTSTDGTNNDGTGFEIAQGTSSITTLASFNGTNGQIPYAGVILDSSGDVFGTTTGGGADQDGTVFEIADGTASIATLASFNVNNGADPYYGTLTLDSSGDLFGTTGIGGDANGDGSVFELTPAATDVVVNSVSDTATGAGIVTLSDAVNIADSSTTPTSITFDPTVFAAAQTITLNGSDLELSNTSEPTTITGSAAGVTISGNNVTQGIQIDAGVTATLADLTISNCNSDLGAGIINSGNLTLADSTLSDNDATSDDDGGGLANEGTATLINDTLADNTGDGLDQRDGAATLINCTVSGNSSYSPYPAGGIYIDGGTVTIGNSIVAGNTAASGGGDVDGTFDSLGNNLIGQTDGSTGWISSDLTGTMANPLNPDLAPLASNGGPTQTLLPYTGSPAIGAGSVALVPTGITTDQRGLPRIVNAIVDIGSVQGNSAPAPPVTATIGGLDPTFGVGGLVAHDIGLTSIAGVVAQSNGQTVIAGSAGSPGSQVIGITRYNTDGSLDAAFGTGGVTNTPLPGDAQAVAEAILPDGDILVAGMNTTLVNGQSTGSQFALVEFTSAGVLDTSFGGGSGFVLTSFSSTAGVLSNDVPGALVVAPDGTIYVGGSSDAASATTQFAIAAYTPTGAPLPTFGTDGKVLLGFTGGSAAIAALAIGAKGDLIAAGTANNPSTNVPAVALAELLPDGMLNSKFGVKGQLITSVGSISDGATALAIDAKGNIVVGGYTATGSASAGTLSANFLLLRYTSAGKLDATFGSGGIVSTSFNQPASVTSLLIETSGAIIASGKTAASLASFDPTMLNLAVARYTANGRLDTTFNGTGQLIVNLSNAVVTDTLATPSDTTSDLMSAFAQLTASAQGVIATTTGGDLIDVGNSGANTVEAAIITMGIDLAATLVASLPPSVIGGAKATASVNVTETGTELAQGTFTVELFASSSPSVAAGQSPFQSFPEKLKLKAGAATSLHLKFAYPSSLSKGNYYLVATVDTGTVRNLNPAKLTSVSASTVLIAPPFVLLAGSALTAPVFSGVKPATVSFTIMNTGNEPASAKSAVQFFASTGDTLSGAMSLGTVPLQLNLKPGASHPFKEKLALPATLPAGMYLLLALLDPANVFQDPNAATNFIVSGNMFVVE